MFANICLGLGVAMLSLIQLFFRAHIPHEQKKKEEWWCLTITALFFFIVGVSILGYSIVK